MLGIRICKRHRGPGKQGSLGEVRRHRAVKGVEMPDPEVPAKARRRKHSAEYKHRILAGADACKDNPGAIGGAAKTGRVILISSDDLAQAARKRTT